ncbi:hypothetical protein [Microcoleus sp. bin38.metabat.b11b12b14.051]|uniref:hypothetical protein n=1 Tax=Microcoleus sp. bin38.metabat.b11b12b14.051 TaxID=2742709 RepID=UPI0025D1020E|nr:hypothetical protein [Microcoleus sp. bin38.metabat.b11b12b14.051]
MNICTIGYGRGSTHDFESSNYREYVYMEAKLEPWENTEESLILLRQVVCSKIGLSESVTELESQRESLSTELAHILNRIEEARQRWSKIESFMEKIGSAVEFDPIPF